MGERKVLNKYYPPDFDPSLLPRNKKPRDQQIKVRTMLPMSICCASCGEYLYQGKKFNAKKETVLDEDYLGIRIFRFYIRCTRCSAQITFKTDPKNSDYKCEHGATRNFEPWRQAEDDMEGAKRQREEEDADSMKALENRTLDNKHELDSLDALDELRSMQSRHAEVSHEELLRRTKAEHAAGREAQEQADREEARLLFEEKRERLLRLEDE
eukprot:CAMPEP_0119151190 /NCGR_PEP_ID=MMETSP1310-20130426/45981_1 /TAXON_ID=464262 /ORGANISM="Genus nov. species nov., Strain RCC2339" /LENGTH=211 /DNA_ID=CAMNT_0007143447 /DNA_START=31 /DNA_END=663 /DNA_ORIENTATION=-